MSHIFISYSHKDTEYAHALAKDLQGHGFSVWIDERLDYGSQWPMEIQKQLDTCDAFILVMSPRSFSSDWVQSELQRAKRKMKPIFPLLLEGDEPWLSVESTQYYDVRTGRFPDSKFYSALKRIVAINPTAQTFSSLRKPIPTKEPTKEPAKASRPANNLMLIFGALIGAVAVLGICLVVAFLFLRQKTADINPSSDVATQELVSNTPTQRPVSTTQTDVVVPPVDPVMLPTATLIPTATLAPVATRPVANFGGEWWTNFAKMNLQQVGDTVSGTYVQYGTSEPIQINGTVDGFVLTGKAAGTVIEFTMNESEAFFDGWWDSNQQNQWCGVRSGQSLPDGCGLTGRWNVGGRTWPDGSAMKLTQTGSQVQGTYTANGPGQFDGSIQATLSNYGFSIDGTWTVGSNSGIIHWEFVDRTYNQLRGYFDAPNNSWCAWRKGAGNPCP